jgi:hypothetical protein
LWANTWVEVWDCFSRDRQSFKDVKFGGAADAVLGQFRTPFCPVHDSILVLCPMMAATYCYQL